MVIYIVITLLYKNICCLKGLKYGKTVKVYRYIHYPMLLFTEKKLLAFHLNERIPEFHIGGYNYKECWNVQSTLIYTFF